MEDIPVIVVICVKSPTEHWSERFMVAICNSLQKAYMLKNISKYAHNGFMLWKAKILVRIADRDVMHGVPLPNTTSLRLRLWRETSEYQELWLRKQIKQNCMTVKWHVIGKNELLERVRILWVKGSECIHQSIMGCVVLTSCVTCISQSKDHRMFSLNYCIEIVTFDIIEVHNSVNLWRVFWCSHFTLSHEWRRMSHL